MAKGRESGMPEEAYWQTFFNPECIVSKLDCGGAGDLIEFGCGYGLFTVPAAKAVSEVAKVARDAGVTRIVVGLPLRLDGTEGPEAKRARTFGEAVGGAAGVSVVFVDERLTTALASRALDAGRVKATKRREVVDQAAATVLLQGYLDSMGGGEWDADEPDDAP